MSNFTTYRNTIDSQEEELLGFNHVEQSLKIKENVLEDLLLSYSEVYIIVVRMRAVVDDAIHVEIQTVELWNLLREISKKILFWFAVFRLLRFSHLIFTNQLAKTWITFAYVAEELGNSHDAV